MTVLHHRISRFWVRQGALATRIGERQRQTKQTPARRRAPQQIDLFTAEPQMTIGDMPAWSGLPPETQAALTGLMTRLILEHADKNLTGSIAEVGHDL